MKGGGGFINAKSTLSKTPSSETLTGQALLRSAIRLELRGRGRRDVQEPRSESAS